MLFLRPVTQSIYFRNGFRESFVSHNFILGTIQTFRINFLPFEHCY